MAINDLVVAKINISREAVDAYRHATNDTNKLHDDIDLGMRMSSVLHHLARAYREHANASLAPEDHLSIHCSEQVTDFKGAVIIGTDAFCTMTQKDQNTLEACMYLPDANGSLVQPSVISVLSYDPPRMENEQKPGLSRHEFILQEDAAAGVGFSMARTIPNIKTDDLRLADLALGFISPSLIKDGAKLVEAAKEAGKDPVYARLALKFLGNPILCPGDLIEIYTNCGSCRDRQGVYMPRTFVRHNGTPLYQLTAALAFEERAKILAPMRTAS